LFFNQDEEKEVLKKYPNCEIATRLGTGTSFGE